MSENTQEILDEASDVIEQTLDVIEDGYEVVRNNVPLMIGVGVAGLVAGATIGYFIGVKRVMKDFDQRLDEEAQNAKQYYASLNKVNLDGTPLTPAQVARDLGITEEALAQKQENLAMASLRDYRGEEDDVQDEALADKAVQRAMKAAADAIEDTMASEVVTEVETTVETPEATVTKRQVFVDPGFDYEEEVLARDPAFPYLITREEHNENPGDYEQSAWTYFEIDGVVIDERDNPVENAGELAGEDNMVRFGSGSGDRNTVFIRNDRLEMDFEVVRDTGSYVEGVLGLTDQQAEERAAERRRRQRNLRNGDE